MRLHNFIVDHCNNQNFSTSVDCKIFDDDCWHFFAVNHFMDDIGVCGGEDNVCRDEDGGECHMGAYNESRNCLYRLWVAMEGQASR